MYNEVREHPFSYAGQALGSAAVLGAIGTTAPVLLTTLAIGAASSAAFGAYKKDNPVAGSLGNFGVNAIGTGLLTGMRTPGPLPLKFAVGVAAGSIAGTTTLMSKLATNNLNESQFAKDNPNATLAANVLIPAAFGAASGGLTPSVPKGENLLAVPVATVTPKIAGLVNSISQGAAKKTGPALGGAAGNQIDKRILQQSAPPPGIPPMSH
jgi:hypothetical protein